MNVSLIDGHIDGKKMSDEDIMKALECCFTDNFSDCKQCPLKDRQDVIYSCMRIKQELAIDLINRLQTEIEMMRNYIHDHNLEWDLLSYSKRNDG